VNNFRQWKTKKSLLLATEITAKCRYPRESTIKSPKN
jgi:hypothetical protein